MQSLGCAGVGAFPVWKHLSSAIPQVPVSPQTIQLPTPTPATTFSALWLSHGQFLKRPLGGGIDPRCHLVEGPGETWGGQGVGEPSHWESAHRAAAGSWGVPEGAGLRGCEHGCGCAGYRWVHLWAAGDCRSGVRVPVSARGHTNKAHVHACTCMCTEGPGFEESSLFPPGPLRRWDRPPPGPQCSQNRGWLPGSDPRTLYLPHAFRLCPASEGGGACVLCQDRDSLLLLGVLGRKGGPEPQAGGAGCGRSHRRGRVGSCWAQRSPTYHSRLPTSLSSLASCPPTLVPLC